MNLEGGNALINNRAQPNDCAFAYGYAWGQGGARSHPGTVFQPDGTNDQGKRWIGPIVITGAQISALRKADVIANGDWHQIVDPTFFAEPAVISHSQVPGIFHREVVLHYCTMADFSTKRPQ